MTADSPPMSGLPPCGIFHLATSLRVARFSTEMLPSSRLLISIFRESRVMYRPCVPLPVFRKPVTFSVFPSISHNPFRIMSAT